MSVLRRDDGALFILQPYRELLPSKNTALLKREFFLLSQQYGIFSRIFKQHDGCYEAVFSRDGGYLLGETVWHHFNKPQDLLYCEALPEKDQVLVVVVRNGHVYLDTKMAYDQLTDELVTLHAGTAHFEVYVYGDVPVGIDDGKASFVLEAERVKSFTRLDASLWASLPTVAELNLLPIESAVAELKLNQRAYQVAAVLSGLVLLSAAWLWFSSPSAPVAVTQQKTVDLFQQYAQALTTPDPAVQLREFAQQLAVVYSIPGWTPTNVVYNGSNAQFELHSLGGSISSLLQWGSDHHLKIMLSSNGAQLLLSLTSDVRSAPQIIINSQQTIATLVDRMMRIVPSKSVQIGNVTPHGIYNETSATITLTSVSPDVLSLIGQALSGLPVNVTGGTLSVNNGFLSGNFQLTLLGN